MVVVFFAAGCLEVVSILVSPRFPHFRLYGNHFWPARTSWSHVQLVPGFAGSYRIPFYFLELVMGLFSVVVHVVNGGVHDVGFASMKQRDCGCARLNHQFRTA